MRSPMTTQVRTEPTASAPYWVEAANGHARFRAKIAGLHCSLCTGTIEKAIGQLPGVGKVAVSLTHEQALVDYDPARVTPEELHRTLQEIGYSIWDPRKLRPYEEEEADLVREGRRLLAGTGGSLVTIALLLNVMGVWSVLVPAVVGVTLVTLAFLILRSEGVWRAVLGMATLGLALGGVLLAKTLGLIQPAVPWLIGAFAVIVVFGLTPHFLAMAAQSIRRGILNQHVLLEFGAFAGLAGGLIGLILQPAQYPTAAFFGVSVLI